MTDVDETTGPHCYYPESHKLAELVRCRDNASITTDEFNLWYGNKLRKTDEECTELLGRDPVNITGPKGSQLMVDTSGIHKGLLPIQGRRLLVQFEYCATANPLTSVELAPLSELVGDNEELRAHFTNPTIKYACQLFIDYDR